MGARLISNCQRSNDHRCQHFGQRNRRAPGGIRTHVTALRRRYPGQLDDQCFCVSISVFQTVGPEGFEPSPVGLRDPDATVTPWTQFLINDKRGLRFVDMFLD